MIILQANKIERSFAGEVLFDNITLQVDERDRIALVGKNGAGKSTLLKILVGEEEPTSGEINKKKDISLSYLAQDSRFESENTIYDEMLHVFDDLRRTEKQLRQMELEMGEKSGEDLDKLMADYDRLSENFRQAGGFTYEADIRAILNGFKFDESMWQMKIAELSGGQNTRLALAKMLLEKPNLLVLDEPTNHLDIETIAWLENYLVNYSGALIIVSHDRYFLDKVATVTLDLTKHSLDRYVGNYSRFVELKEQKLATEAKNYEKQQKEIAALEDFVNRNLVRASTTKRAQSRRKQLEKMERLDKPESGKKSANMTFQSEKTSGNVVLTVENAAIGYDGEILSEPINLDLRKMNAVAIVGPNGIGKSTFIKSIVDQIPFIKGEKRFGANVEVGYYDQTQSKLTPSNTVLDELWNDFKLTPEVEIRNRLGAFLFSGDDVKKSVGMLSGGEKARLLLAKLSMENNNFLILDEPTNHLDNDMVLWLEEFLNSFRGVLIMVTHDRYFLDRVTNKIVEIDKGKLYEYDTNYSGFVELKVQREEMELATERKRQSLLRVEMEWMKQGIKARGTRQRARTERFEELKNAKGPSMQQNVEMDSISSRLGKTTIELEHISKGFGDKHLINDFSYIFLRDDRIGFIGPNGCGKSTLMKMIMGILKPDEGNITIGDTVKIGYFAQENEDMTGDIRVIDYIKNVAEYIQTTKGQTSASQMLDRFLFPPELQYTPLDKLSGGEQRRLYLLKVLMEAPNVLILDEPTNDLDIQTLTILEDYLDTFAGIVITVSHDRYFLDRIVNRIFAFEEGGHLKQYEGGYTDYLEKVKPAAKPEKSKPAKKENNGKKFQKEHQKKLKFTYKEQKEFETIDDDIAKLEEKLEQLDEEIMENATNSGKLAELTEQKESAQAELDEKMDRWVYLNDLAEQIANQ